MPGITRPKPVFPKDRSGYLGKIRLCIDKNMSPDEYTRRINMRHKKWYQDNVFDRLRIKLADREKIPASGEILMEIEDNAAMDHGLFGGRKNIPPVLL